MKTVRQPMMTTRRKGMPWKKMFSTRRIDVVHAAGEFEKDTQTCEGEMLELGHDCSDTDTLLHPPPKNRFHSPPAKVFMVASLYL